MNLNKEIYKDPTYIDSIKYEDIEKILLKNTTNKIDEIITDDFINTFSNESSSLAKKNKMSLILSLILAFFLIMFAVFMVLSSSYENNAYLYVGLSFLGISFLPVSVLSYILYKKSKIKNKIHQAVRQKIDIESLKKDTISCLGFVDWEDNHMDKTLENSVAEKFIAVDSNAQYLKTETIIYKKGSVASNPFVSYNLVHNYKMEYKDSDNKTVIKYFSKKQFVMEYKTNLYPKNSFLIGKNKRVYPHLNGLNEYKLENDNFENEWFISADDELQPRIFLTLLAQENLYNIGHWEKRGIYIYKRLGSVYVIFSDDDNTLDFFNGITKEKIKKSIISEINLFARNFYNSISCLTSIPLLQKEIYKK